MVCKHRIMWAYLHACSLVAGRHDRTGPDRIERIELNAPSARNLRNDLGPGKERSAHTNRAETEQSSRRILAAQPHALAQLVNYEDAPVIRADRRRRRPCPSHRLISSGIPRRIPSRITELPSNYHRRQQHSCHASCSGIYPWEMIADADASHCD